MNRESSHRLFLPGLLAAASVLLLVVLSACGDPGDGPATKASRSPSPDAVAAVVDGEQVPAREVQRVRAERRFTGQSEEDGGPALDEAVERALMRREAARLGAVAGKEEIGRRMTELETSSGGAAALDGLLRQARMSRAELRQSIADGVLREALRDAKYAATRATSREVGDYYERNRASLFTRPASVRLAAIQVRTEMIAENAIGRLAEGHTFAEVARQFSVDPESRADGGELGWVATSSLPPFLREAVAGAGRGVLPRPVGEGSVWYVVNVQGKRPARVTPLAEVRARLTTELTRLKRSRALERWLDAARERATITTP